jgi:hypothetical protein
VDVIAPAAAGAPSITPTGAVAVQEHVNDHGADHVNVNVNVNDRVLVGATSGAGGEPLTRGGR